MESETYELMKKRNILNRSTVDKNNIAALVVAAYLIDNIA